MRRTLCALVLVLTLGSHALAREIHNPPPQPPPSAPEEVTTEGEIHTPGLAEVVLNLFTLF